MFPYLVVEVDKNGNPLDTPENWDAYETPEGASAAVQFMRTLNAVKVYKVTEIMHFDKRLR